MSLSILTICPGCPARSCPTGFSPSAASSSSHLRSQAEILLIELLQLHFFFQSHALIFLLFRIFSGMRHELESKMRKNQRKLEMQYSFTSLRGSQLRSVDSHGPIPWTPPRKVVFFGRIAGWMNHPAPCWMVAGNNL